MTFAEYRAINAINWSSLREIRRSPKHYRHLLDHGREDTSTLALGRAAHTAVLEPERFPVEYVVFEGARRAGKEWEAFKEGHADKTILKVDEYAQVIAIRDAVLGHRVAASRLSGGVAEHTITWSEKINGVTLQCKARLDYLAGAIADLKSTRDASSAAFGRTAARFGYHCQGAWYRRGVRAVTGEEKRVVLIAVEADAPHDVAVYRVDDDALWSADEEINELLVRVASCRAHDRWPGVHEEESVLELPRWALASDDDGELTAEVIE